MNTLNTKWREYQSGAIPESAGERQIDAMRKAFYAGTAAVLDILDELGEVANTGTEIVPLLNAIYDECDAFSATKN